MIAVGMGCPVEGEADRSSVVGEDLLLLFHRYPYYLPSLEVVVVDVEGSTGYLLQCHYYRLLLPSPGFGAVVREW